MAVSKTEYEKVIVRKIRSLPRTKQREVLDYIERLNTAPSTGLDRKAEFEKVLKKSRIWFRNWLKKQGYAPNSLTDEQVEQIISSV